ncbi:MAG: TIGR02221 family CRISPR-associated protein [Chloroflexota bacterium]
MKLLTFLGTGLYEETEYCWNDQPVISRFAPVASCKFISANQAVVFATSEAELAHGSSLRELLAIPVQFVPVPKGETETELWEIFSKVAKNVEPGEEVAFDVTHGLRSFPLIGILTAAFLRVGMDVSLKAVFYGAFDVRDRSVTPHRTRMFDLTPMLSLLEWAAAADRFNRTGDARYFASLLKQQQKKLALQDQRQPERLDQIGHIGRLASILTDISQSLSLIRPHLAMQLIETLPKKTESALPILAEAEAAQPFQLLLDSTLNTYQPLAMSDPSADPRQDLLTQRVLINWYAEREHWAQAVSLAREWLVSWVMIHLGLKDLITLSDRQRIEHVVNSEAEEYLKTIKQDAAFQPVFLKSIPDIEKVLSLWKSLTETRNDIDHAGMRENPQKPDDLIKQIKTHIELLKSLPV